MIEIHFFLIVGRLKIVISETNSPNSPKRVYTVRCGFSDRAVYV